MKFTHHFAKTLKDASAADVSRNAQLLTRAGFVNQLMSGVYSYLPLGLRTLTKIETVIRQEMDAIGGQEILMPALQPREIWDATGRWDKVDVLFKLKGQGDRDLALGPTHEEVVTPLLLPYLQSYRDLPCAVYQIQTKFRNEPRAKSGLLRGREFRMKDMYSFHADQPCLDDFYDRAIGAYLRVYERCGLGALTLLTYASGGIFSKYSHEFQTVTPYGEDTIYRLPGTDKAINKEIVDDPEVRAELLSGNAELEEVKAIEVGNIFKLGTRFSEAFNLHFATSGGARQPALMGCYGLGPSRVMGTIAECLSDDKGLVWPAEVAPFDIHLIALAKTAEEMAPAAAFYETARAQGFDVLFDDRPGVQAGQKFADADLIGLPHRVVISPKTVAAGQIEWKPRAAADSRLIETGDFLGQLRS